MQSRALFLDRDGVINVDKGYVHHTDEFEFIDGIFSLARLACANGYKIVVVTNQAGIGRGYYTEQQFHELTVWMCKEFLKAGAPIEKVYFSPFHPTEGLGEYRKDDVSRKPHPGMIIQAKQELNLDLVNSILIGDKLSDMQAGIAAGIGHNILLGQADQSEISTLSYQAIENLLDVFTFFQERNAIRG